MTQAGMQNTLIILLIGEIYVGDMGYLCVKLVAVFNVGKKAIKLVQD